MLKVLLVDDEPFITQGLSVLVDWNSLGFTIAGVMASGKQALRFLQKNPVDLIIADIQMPGMSGLELLKTLRQEQISDAYFVILSGYSEFEYARQAMRYSCEEYLLKPVMAEQLTALLEKVRESRRSSQAQKVRDEAMGQAYLTHNLLALLHGNYDAETVRQVREELHLSGKIRYINVSLNFRGEPVVPQAEKRRLRKELLKAGRQILGAAWNCRCLPEALTERDECGIGIILSRDMSRDAGKDEHAYLLALQKDLQAMLPAAVELFVGKEVEQLSDLAVSYHTALRIRALRQYQVRPAGVHYYQPAGTAEQEYVDTDALQALVSAIVENDKQSIRNTLQTLCQSIRMDSNPDVLRVNMDYLLYRLVQIANDWDKTVDRKELLCHLQKNLFRSNAPGSYDRLVQFVQEYADYLASLRQGRGDDVLSKIEQEVQLRYAENLSLKEFSRKYYVNSAYLGQQFKKKYGVSFREYLNNYRIEQAASLLLTTKEKVLAIARRVGYQDMDYFIERFINKKGCTPSAFRKQYGQNVQK